jgi:hypothetical protein
MRLLPLSRRPVRVPRAALSLPGLALFSGLLLGLPLSPNTVAQMQSLNRELGKLCNNPPGRP